VLMSIVIFHNVGKHLSIWKKFEGALERIWNAFSMSFLTRFAIFFVFAFVSREIWSIPTMNDNINLRECKGESYFKELQDEVMS